MKSFYTAKGSTSPTKRLLSEEDMIFAGHTSDKRLIINYIKSSPNSAKNKEPPNRRGGLNVRNIKD